jgi:hypothetical protein
MPLASTAFLQRTILIISTLLISLSFITIGLTGHANWLLAEYFPGGAWYMWKGDHGTTSGEDQEQQWVTVDYNLTTERLTFMGAALSSVAGALGVLAAVVVNLGCKVCSIPSHSEGRQPSRLLILGASFALLLFEEKKKSILTFSNHAGIQLPYKMVSNNISLRLGLCRHSLHWHAGIRHMVQGNAKSALEELSHTHYNQWVQH